MNDERKPAPEPEDNEEWTHALDGDWEPHFDDVCEDNEDARLCDINDPKLAWGL